MANNSIEDFLENSQPLVTIPANVMEYIQEIVSQCKDEVSWVMEVTELDNFIYQIDDVYLPRQKVHGTTTEFDAQDIINLMDEEPNFNPAKWRGWGHSHVNMGTTPSGQDGKMMKEFAKDCEFFVGMIHNKRGEIFCWVVDNTRKIFFRDVPIEVVSEYEDEIKELIKKRVSKLIEPPPKVPTNSNVGKQSSLEPTYTKYSPFKVRGLDVMWCTRSSNGFSQCGYDVEGIFYPTSLYDSADEAVKAHLGFMLDTLNGVPASARTDVVPAAYQMEVLEEIEDYNSKLEAFNERLDNILTHGTF